MTDPRRRGEGERDISRRTVLRWTSAGVVGLVGGGLLAGCSDEPAPGTAATAPPGTGTDDAGAAPVGTAPVLLLESTPGPVFTSAPGAVAAAMGFYRDEGIELSTEYPGSSVRSIQTLVGGSGDLGVADSFALLVASGEDLDLRSIYLIARGYAFGFAVEAGSEIEGFDEDTVRGTRIGVTDFSGGEVPVLRGALARLGIEEGGDDGVELVPIGFGGAETADAIESGSVDIVAASVLDFEIFRTAGVELRTITPDYIGAFPGHSFVTTPDRLADQRDVLVRMLRANAKATVFIRGNPDAATEMAIAAAPASAEGVDPAIISGLLQTLYVEGNAFAFDEDDPNYHRLGVQEVAAYDDYQGFLIETGSESDDGATLTEEVEVDGIIDNDLIDDVNDFDYAEIEALAASS